MIDAGPIDKQAVRRKHLEERDKRLRADGNEQYVQLKSHLSHYLDDRYTQFTPRPARTDHVTFSFIGGGFAGLVTGARLVESGIEDVRIIDKAGDFGGTGTGTVIPVCNAIRHRCAGVFEGLEFRAARVREESKHG